MTGPRAGSGTGALVVCTLATGLGGTAGFVFGVLAPQLQADLGIGRTGIGLLVGLAFGASAAGSVPGGLFTDRFGARAAVAADLVVLAGALVLAAALGAIAALVGLAVAAGFGYAFTSAGTTAAIAVRVPAGRQGWALAVRTLGIPLSVAALSLAATATAAVAGWRWFLGALAVPALVLAASAWWLLPGRAPRPPAAAPVPARLPRGFAWLPAAAFLLIAGIQPVIVWPIPFLTEVHGVRPATAAALAAASSAAGVAGLLVLARVSARAPAGDDRGTAARQACLRAGVLTAAAAAGVLLVALSDAVAGAGVPVAAAGLAVAMATHLPAVGFLFTAVVALVPARSAGRGSGVMAVGFFLGAVVSAPLFGLVADHAGYPPAWLLSAALVLAGAGCFARAARVRTVPDPAGCLRA